MDSKGNVIQKWEYEYVGANEGLISVSWGEEKKKDLVEYLNIMGDNGWELVEYNNRTFFCIFKRPKP